MAIYLDIDAKTLRNWKKNKPNLYKIVMLGFAFEKVVEKSKKNYEELEKLAKDAIEN